MKEQKNVQKKEEKNVPANSIVELAKTITTDMPSYTPEQKLDVQANINRILNAPFETLTPQEMSLRFEMKRLKAYDEALSQLPAHLKQTESERLTEKAITIIMDKFEPYYSNREEAPQQKQNQAREIGEALGTALTSVYKGLNKMKEKGVRRITTDDPWDDDYFPEETKKE